MDSVVATESLRHENALLTGQKRILEMIATGAPLDNILSELTCFIEAQEEGLTCGILIVTDDGTHFRRGCGPRLPEVYHRTLDGVPITPPYLGACGEAAHCGRAVIVPDIARDTRFTAAWRDMVLSCGLAACRSTPVFAADGRVLASFAMYYDRPRDPHPAHPELIEIATHLAGIALERDRATAALRRNEARLASELDATRWLQKTSTLLIQEDDADALYAQVLEAAIGLMQSDAASMQMLDPGRNELRLLAWAGFHPASAAFWEWVRFDSGSTCGLALQTGRRVVVPDVEACGDMAGTRNLEEYRRSGLRAVQSTPLVSRTGQLLGMISTHWRTPHEPSERDLGLMDVLARQAADLIERARGEAALRAGETQLRMALGAAKFGHWQLDLPQRTLTSSDQCKANFGRAPDDPFPYESFRTAIHPDDRDGVAAAVKRAIAMRGDYEADYRCRWPDGSIHWINARGRVIDDGGGAPLRMIGVTLDITESKQAEERLKLLLAELNHRVKNTLATVQSIAAQTLRSSGTDARTRETFEARLVALSKAHSLLRRDNWRGVGLRDLLGQELAPYRDGAATLCDGPAVRLRPKTAIALGMAFHELATNAVKYGALSAPAGQVRVDWEIVDVAGETRLRLTWTESGGPPVEPPSRKGFGSRLIERGLALDLGGEVRIEYARGGVACTIEAPLAVPDAGQTGGNVLI